MSDKERIENAVILIKKALDINSQFVDYDFGVELLKGMLLDILLGDKEDYGDILQSILKDSDKE